MHRAAAETDARAPAEGEDIPLAGAALLSPIIPSRVAGLGRSDVMSLAAALVLHGGVIYAVARGSEIRDFGSGGTVLEVISIELVEESAGSAMRLAAVSVAGGDGGAADPRPTLLEPTAKTPAEPMEVAAAPQAVPEPDAMDLAGSKTMAKDDAQNVPATALAKGAGAGVPAEALDRLETAARPEVMAGVAQAYASSIFNALARNKPTPRAGATGIVRVSFTVASTGEAAEVRVARSSGKSLLDAAAVDSVKSARFPSPPGGLTSAQLTYEIPYIFR